MTSISDFDNVFNPINPSVKVWRAVLRDYGNDTVEMGCHRPPLITPKKKDKSNDNEYLVLDAGTTENPEFTYVKKEKVKTESNEERSIRRSRATLARRARALGADRLLTLTYRENMEDEKEAWKDFQWFIRFMREDAYPNFAYVAVTERQERGSIHFHLAIKGYHDVNIVRGCWRAAIGRRGRWLSGNIDIEYRHNGNKKSSVFNGRSGLRTLCAYLCKYMSKTMEGKPMFKRRYSVSKGIKIPSLVIWAKTPSELIEIFEQYASKIRYFWSDLEGDCLYMCSW